MTHPDASFMSMAVEEASRGAIAGDGGPFGAVVVKDGRKIGSGCNMVVATKDPTMHAEMSAIKNACKELDSFDLSGCVMYTSCYPCPMCLGAIVCSKIRAVYYAASLREAGDRGFDTQSIYEFMREPISTDQHPIERLVCDNHMKPFDDWASNTERTKY